MYRADLTKTGPRPVDCAFSTRRRRRRRAEDLALRHTESTLARSLDILHVAAALILSAPRFIAAEESLYLAFGCDLINTVREENPEAWTPEFRDELVHLIQMAVDLEAIYARGACPDGILGINADAFVGYVEHIADRRLERIGLPAVYQTDNPFPWMSQATDLSSEKNFFETRVTEYQTGSLTWD